MKGLTPARIMHVLHEIRRLITRLGDCACPSVRLYVSSHTLFILFIRVLHFVLGVYNNIFRADLIFCLCPSIENFT
jgi:hypothetical protein